MSKLVIDCISDTHMYHNHIKFPTPDLQEGDVWVLVHAGDFTNGGHAHEVNLVAKWLRQLPHHRKVIVAGNHERATDFTWVSYMKELAMRGHIPLDQADFYIKQSTVDLPKKLRHFDYLNQNSVVINGIKFWGSPYSLRFKNWGYQLDPTEAKDHWSNIPDDADVVITHGPAKYHGDRCPDIDNSDKMVFVGDTELLHRLEAVQPKLHVCGHVHEGRGHHRISGTNLNNTTVLNASFLGNHHLPSGNFFRIHINTETKQTSNLQELSII